MPLGCKAVLLYSGSNEEYWAFLTPEASRTLDDYVDHRLFLGEKITQQFLHSLPLASPSHKRVVYLIHLLVLNRLAAVLLRINPLG